MEKVSLPAIQRTVWDGRIPLQIVLAPSESRSYNKTDPYLVSFLSHVCFDISRTNAYQISFPRISYLPSLLPRLRAFYSSSLINPNSQHHEGWFEFEGVPLK